MKDELKIAKDILKKYNQEHLLMFYDNLDDNKKTSLVQQILSINFEEILYLYEKSKFDVLDTTEEVAPLPYTIKDDISSDLMKHYISTGDMAISDNKVAVLTLAGGQGSRLGFDGPKGTFMLNVKPKISLFEIFCNNLKLANQKYNINIYWYIMTSNDNNKATIDFFEKNNYFCYNKEYIVFFVQDSLPIIDVNGKLILDELHQIKTASNGNGNVFKALKEHRLIDDMEAKNINWVFIGGVDNVLLNPLDSLFIGMTIASGNDIASKTLFKKNPCDINWVFAIKNGKPTIVDCENFVEQLSLLKDTNGKYLYREVNMLSHLFSLNAIKKLSNVDLDYHRAFRKSTFVNSEGVKQVPNSPNIYKFEQFVFDAFPFFDDITLLRVNECEEFAPIKSFNGPYNPDFAAKMYSKNVLHCDFIDDD